MNRFLVLSAATLFAIHASPAHAQVITVSGKYSNGSFVNATCTVNNGQVTGTGVLYGNNNGYIYQYPFTINRATTVPGAVILYGKIVGGPDMALKASVPSGAQTFAYVVNGNTYTLSGSGTVTVK